MNTPAEKANRVAENIERSPIGRWNSVRADGGRFPRLDELPYFITWPLAAALARTSVHPNQVGLLSFLAGLGFVLVIGCSITPSLSVIPLIPLVIRILLDGVDGQLARLSGQTSALGALYDLVSDFVFALLVFPSLAVYLWRSGSLSPLIVFPLAVAATGAFILSSTAASLTAKLSTCLDDQTGFLRRFSAAIENDRPAERGYSRKVDLLNRVYRLSWLPAARLVSWGLIGDKHLRHRRRIAHLLSPFEYGIQFSVLAGILLLDGPLVMFFLYPIVGMAAVYAAVAFGSSTPLDQTVSVSTAAPEDD